MWLHNLTLLKPNLHLHSCKVLKRLDTLWPSCTVSWTVCSVSFSVNQVEIIKCFLVAQHDINWVQTNDAAAFFNCAWSLLSKLMDVWAKCNRPVLFPSLRWLWPWTVSLCGDELTSDQFRGNHKTFTDSESLSFSWVTVSEDVQRQAYGSSLGWGLGERRIEVSCENWAGCYPGCGPGSGCCRVYQNLQFW